ncbi:MAG: alpha-galactosidase, partial [Clostridia bacterium]|nr:alpha-galactosidase [Clostridia bacterium]
PSGSNWNRKEFFCDVDELACNSFIHHIYPGVTKKYSCIGGRSADGTAPFFNIHKKGVGYVMAIGWSGQWNAIFTRAEKSVNFKSGIEGADFYLNPHERFRTSSVVIMAYEGDFISSQNKWRRLVKEHFSLIGSEGRDKHGPLCASIWGGMETSAVLERINKIVEEKLPFEYVWMDAGWYGEDTLPTPDEFEGDWFSHAGDWRVSRHIHPQGLCDVSSATRKAGMKFLLWFEPERAILGTPVVENHPEYFIKLGENKSLLLNLGHEGAWQYCYETLAGMIEKIGIDCYRQDFNFPPLAYWRENDIEHRRGITEIYHINGLYRLWDALLSKFPHLLIDNCASGGRRIDIELLRRSIPLWRSDAQCPANYEVISAQLHNLTFNSWLPYSGSGSGRAYDEYRVRSSYGASLSASYSLSQKEPFADTPEKVEFIRKYTNEYLRVRPYFSEDFYPLTAVSSSADAWCVSQFDRPSEQDGMLIVIRRPDSPFEQASFPLYAIDKNATYELEDIDGGTRTISGNELSNGLVITIPKGKASIFFYRKKD